MVTAPLARVLDQPGLAVGRVSLEKILEVRPGHVAFQAECGGSFSVPMAGRFPAAQIIIFLRQLQIIVGASNRDFDDRKHYLVLDTPDGCVHQKQSQFGGTIEQETEAFCWLEFVNEASRLESCACAAFGAFC